MDWWDDYHEYDEDAAREEFLEESLKSISHESAKSYLGTYGDAIDGRVLVCLQQAEALLASDHPGPALCLAATALELMIRFLVLRPLVQGAFLSDEWAGILARRVASGRTAEDRALLPAVLRQWGIDITTIRTPSGILLWEFVRTELKRNRDNFVHRGDRPVKETAVAAFECARHFRAEVVGSIASRLEFTLETTGKWCQIRVKAATQSGVRAGDTYYSRYQDFEPRDPFTEDEFTTREEAERNRCALELMDLASDHADKLVKRLLSHPLAARFPKREALHYIGEGLAATALPHREA